LKEEFKDAKDFYGKTKALGEIITPKKFNNKNFNYWS